jgi:hypothetical protein
MPTRLKRLKVGVYRLELFGGNEVPSLLEIVQAIKSLPDDDESRTMMIDEPIRPRGNIIINEQYCLLDFNRIRQTDRIPLADTRGGEGEITFGPKDKKPSERTAVLLDRHSNIMYVHEHSYGIGHTTLGKYIKAIGKLDNIISTIVMHQGGLERLRNKTHEALKIKIAGLDNASRLKAEGLGDGAILKMLQTFKAPTVTLTMSIDKTENHLDQVIETASVLLGWNSLRDLFGRRKPVKEISVVVSSEDEDDALVSLLKDRMVHLEEIELELGKEVTDADRYRAVASAWQRYHVELRERYPKPKDDKG